MEVNNPVNCTFIENQIVENQTVENQIVEHQELRHQPESEAPPFDANDISAADLAWLRTTWGVPEKQQYVLELREALQEESARYDNVSHRKKAILFGVMQPRYLKGEIIGMPIYSVAHRLFGDLPCLPSENNYNKAVECIHSGEL